MLIVAVIGSGRWIERLIGTRSRIGTQCMKDPGSVGPGRYSVEPKGPALTDRDPEDREGPRGANGYETFYSKCILQNAKGFV